MAVRYFRKLVPQNAVTTRVGGIKFDTPDGLHGYFATQNEGIQQDLVGHIQAQRFGITEISAEEFQRDYAEKKTNSTPSTDLWREEISNGRLKSSADPVNLLVGAGAAGAVAANRTDIHPKQTSTPMVNVPQPAAKSTAMVEDPVSEPKEKVHKPNVGRRPKAPPVA